MSGHEVMLAWGKPGETRMLDGRKMWVIGGRRLEFSEDKLVSSR